MEVTRELLFALLTPALLLGAHYHQSLAAKWRVLFAGFTAAVIGACGLRVGQMVLANIAHPLKWDFLLFWLHGRVAAQGLNFYDPGHALQLARQHQLPAYHPGEIGFFYPPQTMFLFMPLGWFEIPTAHCLWYALILGALALDIILLWRIFLNGSGWAGLMLTAALVLALKTTSMTIYFAQTNFIVLLMLLLFWRERGRRRGGVWLAMGIFVKPILAILALYLVWRRNWRVALSTLVALVFITSLAVIAFGPRTSLSYFTSNSIANYPYDDAISSSLLAAVLQLRGDVGSTPILQPLFVILSLALTAITGWLVCRLGPDRADWALSLTLALALLVYPATQEHYGFLLIAPMLLLWARRQELVGGVWGVAGFVSLEYALIRSHWVFIAIALSWCASAGIGAWMSGRRRQSPPMAFSRPPTPREHAAWRT